MMRSLWTAASGMVGQQFNIDTISNNLSNVNTTGFKKQRAEFEDLLYQDCFKRRGPRLLKSVKFQQEYRWAMVSRWRQHKKCLNREASSQLKINLILPLKARVFTRSSFMTDPGGIYQGWIFQDRFEQAGCYIQWIPSGTPVRFAGKLYYEYPDNKPGWKNLQPK